MKKYDAYDLYLLALLFLMLICMLRQAVVLERSNDMEYGYNNNKDDGRLLNRLSCCRVAHHTHNPIFDHAGLPVLSVCMADRGRGAAHTQHNINEPTTHIAHHHPATSTTIIHTAANTTPYTAQLPDFFFTWHWSPSNPAWSCCAWTTPRGRLHLPSCA
jgi:hypothetical protein